MKVRLFAASDAEALVALFKASVQEAGQRDYSFGQVAAWISAAPDAARFLRLSEHRTIVVADGPGREPVGYGELERDGHIDHLYCHPDVIGTGVGSALLRVIETIAREAGLAAMYVEASEMAKLLFERRGFEMVARQDVLLGATVLHNYRMQKRLG